MITIREAGLKDVPSVVRLWKEFMPYLKEITLRHPQLRPYLVKKKNAADIFRAFLEKNVRSRSAAVFIADIDGRLAGYCFVYIKGTVPIYKLEKIGYISDLFIRKEFRGQGISSRFKDEAVKWFKKKGMTHVSIAANVHNEVALSIYKKWEFLDYHIEMRRRI